MQPNPLEDDDSNINNSIQSSEVRDEERQQGLPVVQQGQLPPPLLLYRQPHLQPLPSSSPSSCEEGSSKEDTEEDQGLSDEGNLQAEMESKEEEEFCEAEDSLYVNPSESQRMETSNETSNTSTQPEEDDNNAQPNDCPLEEEENTDIEDNHQEDKSVVPSTTSISSDITTNSTTSNVQNLLPHEQSSSQDVSQQPSSIGSRRPSRNCKPNSLIFNEDTTTLDSPVKRKRRKTDDSGTSGDDNKDSVTLIQQHDLNTVSRNIGSNKKIKKSNLAISETIQEEAPEDPQVLSRITSSGRRSFARESVRNAVSSLTKRRTSTTSATPMSPTSDTIPSNKVSPNGRSINGVSLKGKKLGRPRKYPPFDSPVKEDPDVTPPEPTDLIPLKEKKGNKKSSPSTSASSKKAITINHNNLNHHVNNGHHNEHSNRKSTSSSTSTASPTKNKTKMTPILTAILSGQDISSTKTGRPKGRPRILPSLDKVVLNGTSSPLSSTPIVPVIKLKKSKKIPKKGSSCDCESRYKLMLSELEESLESKFRESTAKLRKDIEERDNESIRLHGRIIALQKEMDMLKKKLEQKGPQPPTAQPFAPVEGEELPERHKAEISRIKKTQWVSRT